jgi:hypothetical protein
MGRNAPASRGAGRRARAFRFIVLIGVVSFFADFTYEGARGIVGPYFALLGASATAVAVVTGFGELLDYAFRLVSGGLSDRTGLFWPITIVGYVIQMVSVPLLARADVARGGGARRARRIPDRVRAPRRSRGGDARAARRRAPHVSEAGGARRHAARRPRDGASADVLALPRRRRFRRGRLRGLPVHGVPPGAAVDGPADADPGPLRGRDGAERRGLARVRPPLRPLRARRPRAADGRLRALRAPRLPRRAPRRRRRDRALGRRHGRPRVDHPGRRRAHGAGRATRVRVRPLHRGLRGRSGSSAAWRSGSSTRCP